MTGSGGEEQGVQVSGEKPEGGDFLEDPCVGGKMLLDWTVEM